EGKTEYFDVPNHPQHPEMGTRKVPFSKHLYIDAEDFAEVPPPKFFRLKPGGEVRLMGAYILKCEELVKNEDGSLKEIRCSCDLETGNGMPKDGRKIKGTIHWLSREYAVDATVMLYEKLFNLENVADMPEDKTYGDYLNLDSVEKLENAKLEPCMADVKPGERFQFVRIGYFIKDTKRDNTYNRIVGLKDSYPQK
ncbi:MAG: glutamine--tRNA ligase, partial [Clostridia bacterium]|nr:glutamine--tRNA ligase [Clostridia bacterium]